MILHWFHCCFISCVRVCLRLISCFTKSNNAICLWKNMKIWFQNVGWFICVHICSKLKSYSSNASPKKKVVPKKESMNLIKNMSIVVPVHKHYFTIYNELFCTISTIKASILQLNVRLPCQAFACKFSKATSTFQALAHIPSVLKQL